MNFKNILKELDIVSQCRSQGLSVWQCPQFLFLIMGMVIVVTSVAIYLMGTRYVAEPQIIALIVLSVAGLLFFISFLITRSFERLAEANRMKSEFINIVSHQLRAPITNLKWALEILTSGMTNKISSQEAEYFRILGENLSRMKDLVSDLLIVSRLETTSLSPRKEEFSLEELTQKIVSNFSSLIKASNIEIKLDSQKGLPKVSADPFQIGQVIENLLDNAIRYMKPLEEEDINVSRGTIKIGIGQKEGDICLEIEDDGVGIPKEDQKYIFQKFFRADNILKQQTQGTGLGLYIAKAIIENSGGKINFKSQKGKGSTFWFSLPLNR